MVFVRSLTKEEVSQLRQFMKKAQIARIFRRAQIIWMSHLGKSVSEIVQTIGYHPQTVISWIHRYGKEGLDGLLDKTRTGRPEKCDKNYVKELLENVHKSPQILGFNQVNWTTELLSKYMQGLTNIQLSAERIRQLLIEHGISFHRPKLHITSPDPLYDEKKGLLIN